MPKVIGEGQQFEEEIKITDSRVDKITSEVERERKQKQFNQKVDLIGQRAAEAVLKDPNSANSKILVALFKCAMKMQETMELVQSFTDMLSFLDTTMEIFDDALNMNNYVMDNSMKNSYGFFAKLKQKRKNKKFINNLNGRIAQMGTQISTMVGVTESLTGMADSIVYTIDASMAKSEAKRAKEAEKAAKKGAPAPSSASVDQDTINLLMSRYNKDTDDGAAPVMPKAPTAKPAATKKDESGYDTSGVL